MNLKDWCKIDETLYSAETNEQYLQFAGHEYDKKILKTLSKIYVEVDNCPVNSKKTQDQKRMNKGNKSTQLRYDNVLLGITN